jgi:alpha-galactosidase/6-phospho-beta-glucosidase family protein
MDINAHHLQEITKCVEYICEEMHSGITITSTTSRKEALKNADAVIITVFNGDVDVWRHEIEIPMKYGVDINVGDTRSVSGIFRALRNIPLMLEICRDIEKICPKAVVLNYTNPMAMLCKAMQTHTNVDVTGLCPLLVSSQSVDHFLRNMDAGHIVVHKLGHTGRLGDDDTQLHGLAKLLSLLHKGDKLLGVKHSLSLEVLSASHNLALHANHSL